MVKKRFIVLFFLCGILCFPRFGFAQVSLEGKIAVISTKPISREEWDQSQSELHLRTAKAKFATALWHHHNDAWIEALHQLEEAKRFDPESLEIQRELLNIYLLLDRPLQAVQIAKAILKSSPEDSESAYQLGMLLAEQANKQEAIHWLKESEKYTPKEDILHDYSKRLWNIYKRGIELAEKIHDRPSEKYFRLGLIHLFKSSLKQLKKSLDLSEHELLNKQIESYEQIAHFYLEEKEFDLALRFFDMAQQEWLALHDLNGKLAAARLNWFLCQIAYRKQSYQEALNYLNLYLETDPREIIPYQTKLDLLEKTGKIVDILPFLKGLSQKNPDRLDLKLLYLQQLSQVTESVTSATSELEKLIITHPSSEVYSLYLEIEYRLHRAGKILSILELSLSEKEKSSELRNPNSEKIDRFGVISKVILAHPQWFPELFKSARGYIFQEKDGPQSLKLWQLLCQMALQAKRYEDADRFLERSYEIAIGYRSDEIALEWLRILSMVHRWDKVEFVANNLIRSRKNPNRLSDWPFRFYYAVALANNKRIEPALKLLDEIASSAPSDETQVECYRQKLMTYANANRLNDAIKEADNLLSKTLSSKAKREIKVTLASIYSQFKKHLEAEKILRELLEENPNDALVNNNLGFNYADRNIHLEEAEKLIRRAIELDRYNRKKDIPFTENAAYLDSLGWVLFRQEKWEESKKCLEQAATLSDGIYDPLVWNHLGDLYFKFRQHDKAKDCWENALRWIRSESNFDQKNHLEDTERKIKMISTR